MTVVFAAVIVRLTVAVAARLPDVPVTITVVGPPVVAELPTVRVSVLVEVVGLVPKVAVTPLGSVDVTARVTLPLKPFRGFNVIVLVPLVPCAMLTELGEAVRLKPGLCCDDEPPPQPDQQRIAISKSEPLNFSNVRVMFDAPYNDDPFIV